MDLYKYDELEDRASAITQRDEILQLEARSRVQKEIAAMIAEEKALVLTEEEERMLRSFRRFRRGCKPGAIFKWQTRPAESGVERVTETGLVRDPREVSEG